MNTHQIREVEAKVLDKYWKNFEILSWDDNFIIPHLFKILGDTIREFKSPELRMYSSFVIRRKINFYIQSLGWCIKWVYENNDVKKKSKFSNTLLSKKALEALNWGTDYHILVQNHVAWSRGYSDVEINIDKKEITFLPVNLEVYKFVLAQELNSDKVFEELNTLVPIDELSKYYSQRKKEVNWNKPPVLFDWNKAKCDTIFSIVLQWTEKAILPEVDNSQLLGGYTLGDLRTLFCGILIHATLIVFAEDEVDRQTNFSNDSGSNPICLSKKNAGLLLHAWSGLSTEAITAIVDDFTFDIKNFHSTLTNQPFVKNKNGILIFLPRFFIHTEFNRMVAGALNKSSKKGYYDKIINIIEKKNLDTLHDFFINNNLVSIKEPALKKNSQLITPDFILVDEVNKSLFVIDYKHYLIPLNANETIFKLAEIKKAIKRVCDYKSLIVAHPEIINVYYTKFDTTYTVTPLLLCKWPIPVPISTNEELYVLTINQFEDLIVNKTGLLRDKIENFYLNLFNNLDKRASNLKIIKDAIKVDEWTYVRSIYAS